MCIRDSIGTELNNKAETIMQVEVDKEDKTVSVVEAVHIRDREFEPCLLYTSISGRMALVRRADIELMLKSKPYERLVAKNDFNISEYYTCLLYTSRCV